MTGMTFLRRAVIATVAAGVALLTAPAPALAHAALLDTSPAAGSVVTTLTTEITLTFSEPVRAQFSAVAVTGSDGVAYATGDPSVQDNVLRQPVHPLRSGDYEVAWRVVSLDGHPVSGTFSFTVQLPAGQEPAEPPPPPPAADDAESGGGRLWWWVPIGAALAVVAVLLVRLGRRRAP